MSTDRQKELRKQMRATSRQDVILQEMKIPLARREKDNILAKLNYL